jgi:hypothetical protein
MTDYSTIYLDEPDIPMGMTIAAYRRSRPRQRRWRRVFRGS